MNTKHHHRVWSPLRFLEGLTSLSYHALFFLWTGMALLFGASYWTLSEFWPGNGITGLERMTSWEKIGSSLYFSIITSTTVGYGDIVPLGLARGLAGLQAAVGFFVFGIFIAKIVSFRQETIVREIHELTFETHARSTREGFFIIRRDFDAIIADARDRKKLDAHSWENLSVACEHGRMLFENIPDFYAEDRDLYVMDAQREKLLLEAATRTLRRLEVLIATLDAAKIAWRKQPGIPNGLSMLLQSTTGTITLWKRKSPHAQPKEFQEILQAQKALATHVGK